MPVQDGPTCHASLLALVEAAKQGCGQAGVLVLIATPQAVPALLGLVGTLAKVCVTDRHESWVNKL